MLKILIVLMSVNSLFAAGPTNSADVIDRFFKAYQSQSTEAMLACYAPDAVLEDINQRHHFEGHDQIAQSLQKLTQMHVSMAIVEIRRMVKDSNVVVEYEYVGTLSGLALSQISGKSGCPDVDYRLRTMSWYVIDSGLIKQQVDFTDLATILEIRERLLAQNDGADPSQN